MKYTVAQVEEALRKYHGKPYLAASALTSKFGTKITSQAIHMRIKKHPRLQAAVEETQELVDSMAYYHVTQAVIKGDLQQCRFHLRYLARKQVVAKQEITGPGGGPVAIDVTERRQVLERAQLLAQEMARLKGEAFWPPDYVKASDSVADHEANERAMLEQTAGMSGTEAIAALFPPDEDDEEDDWDRRKCD